MPAWTLTAGEYDGGDGGVGGNQWQSVAISGNQWQLMAIGGNQWQLVANVGN